MSFAIADKVLGVSISLATMAIVSRILTPAEIGTFLVASAVVVLIEAFRDFGTGACIIQERDLSRAFLRTAFTIMALLSCLLGGTILVLADHIAAFFGEARIGWMIRIAALAFLLAPISTPLIALLRREMAFGTVALISIAAVAANATTSIGLALSGFGPVSLVWGSVAAAAVTAAGALIARPDFTIFRFTLSERNRVLPFGIWTTIVTLLGMAFDSFPRLLLGRTLGFGAVGLFSRALSLSQLTERTLMSAVQPVILSDFSARVRSGEQLGERYVSALGLVASVQWPALLMLALLADPVVQILLGGQWTEVVPLLRVVSLAGLFLFPATLTFPILVAIGRIREMAVVSAILFVVTIAILYGATRFGLMAVALSLFVVNPLQAGCLMLTIRRHVPFSWRALARQVRDAGIVASVTLAGPAALAVATGLQPGAGATALSVLLAAAGWWIGLHLVGSPIAAEGARLVGQSGLRWAPRRA